MTAYILFAVLSLLGMLTKIKCVFYSVMNYDSTGKGPLKRNKKRSTKPAPAVVSGSSDLENDADDNGK